MAKLLDNDEKHKRKETSVNCISILGEAAVDNGDSKADKEEIKAASKSSRISGDNNKKRRKGRHQQQQHRDQKLNESSTSSKDTAEAESDVENGAHRVSRLLGQNKPKR